MKFCKDCRYIDTRPMAPNPVCSHKGSVRISYLITGDGTIDSRKDCYEMRKDGPCGHEGKMWEMKA